MVFKVLASDLQGTLIDIGYRDKKNGEIIRPSPNRGAQSHEFRNIASSFYDANPKHEQISIIAGISEEKTIESLKRISDAGVKIYITTGDGKESKHREDGSMGVVEFIAHLESHQINAEIMNWESIDQTNPEIAAVEDTGKNRLIKAIQIKENISADEIYFMDDGGEDKTQQTVVQKAIRAFGCQGIRVECGNDLNTGLDFVLANLPNRLDVVASTASSSSSCAAMPSHVSHLANHSNYYPEFDGEQQVNQHSSIVSSASSSSSMASNEQNDYTSSTPAVIKRTSFFNPTVKAITAGVVGAGVVAATDAWILPGLCAKTMAALYISVSPLAAVLIIAAIVAVCTALITYNYCKQPQEPAAVSELKV